MDQSIRIRSKAPVTLQYFVPFRFEDSRFDAFNKAFEAEQREGENLWGKTSFPLADNTLFYTHVLSMMNVRENGNSVCRSWKLLLPEGNRYLYMDHRSREEQTGYVFTLTDVYVHLFKTGIGFLGYQVAFSSKRLQDPAMLIRFQNRIKRLNISNKQLYILTGPGDPVPEGGTADSSGRKPVMLGRKLTELLPGSIRPETGFFGVAGENQIPAAALLFSYLCYDCTDRDRLKEITVHMALGYDLRNRQSGETIEACRELTGDVYFYVSQGGCAISVIPNAENENHFVRNSPADKYSFILAVLFYQHCTLLNFTTRLYTDFPSDSRAYLGNSDYADRMQDFITDVDTFLMKGDFSSVSHIQTYNKFYAVSRAALNIEEDKQGLRSGFESLAGIQKSQQEEKLNNRINVIATLLAVLALLPEFCNPDFMKLPIMLVRGKWGIMKGSEKLSLVFFIILFFAAVITIVYVFRSSRKKKRKP